MHPRLEQRLRTGLHTGLLALGIGVGSLGSGCAMIDYATQGTPNQQRLQYEMWKDQQQRNTIYPLDEKALIYQGAMQDLKRMRESPYRAR